MVETDSFFVSVLDDETIKVVSKPNAKMTYKEYDSLYAIYRRLLPDIKQYKLVIVLQEGFSIEKNPIDFIKNRLNVNYRRAEAYVVISPIFKLFVTVGKRIMGNNRPVEIFDHEREAEAWIKKQ